jgi:DNA damage-binding protein 1
MDNVAPILDFAVMDMGNREGETQANEYSSGQARLVTASGAFEGGSLRSVRSGVGLEDVGVLADLEDIQDVFALHSNEESPSDDALIVSFPTETRIFTFDPEGIIEEVDSFRGLALSHPTLLAMNLSNDLILQVTDVGAALLGPGPAFVAAQWIPPKSHLITAASANEGHVLLSTNGLTLVSLDIQQGLKEVAVQTLSDGDQVACIHVPGQIPGIGIAGFWRSGSVSILDLTNLKVIHSEELRRKNDASIPRAIALTQILPEAISGPSLFVAMEDGIVLTFNVNKFDYSLSGRKSVVLGTQQAGFHVLPRDDGLYNVFATCEHPSLIYGSEGRIVYSAVTAQDAVCVCSFDSQAFPNSIVVATSNQDLSNRHRKKDTCKHLIYGRDNSKDSVLSSGTIIRYRHHQARTFQRRRDCHVLVFTCGRCKTWRDWRTICPWRGVRSRTHRMRYSSRLTYQAWRFPSSRTIYCGNEFDRRRE